MRRWYAVHRRAKLRGRAGTAEKEGPSVAPLGPPEAGGSLRPAPVLPSMSHPPPVERAAARRVGSNRLATSRRGALPPIKARSNGMGPPDKGRVRREGDQSLAQPGRRAVLKGLGAPPRFSECPEGGCGTHRAGMVLQRVRTVQGWVVDAADGPQPPLVASLLPLAVRAGALAFAGFAGAPPPTGFARWSSRFSVRTDEDVQGVASQSWQRAKTATSARHAPNPRGRRAFERVGGSSWREDRGRPGDSPLPTI